MMTTRSVTSIPGAVVVAVADRLGWLPDIDSQWVSRYLNTHNQLTMIKRALQRYRPQPIWLRERPTATGFELSGISSVVGEIVMRLWQRYRGSSADVELASAETVIALEKLMVLSNDLREAGIGTASLNEHIRSAAEAVANQLMLTTIAASTILAESGVMAREVPAQRSESTRQIDERDNKQGLTSANLLPVLHEFGLAASKNETRALLKIFTSRGITTVGDLRALATSMRIHTIRETYRSTEGRDPLGVELVATLVNVAGTNQESEIVALTRAQIEFLKLWSTTHATKHD